MFGTPLGQFLFSISMVVGGFFLKDVYYSWKKRSEQTEDRADDIPLHEERLKDYEKRIDVLEKELKEVINKEHAFQLKIMEKLFDIRHRIKQDE